MNLSLPSNMPEHITGTTMVQDCVSRSPICCYSYCSVVGQSMSCNSTSVASGQDSSLVSVPHSPLPDERPQAIIVHKLIIPVGQLGSASPPSPTVGMAPVSQSAQSHDGHGSSKPVSPVAQWAWLQSASPPSGTMGMA